MQFLARISYSYGERCDSKLIIIEADDQDAAIHLADCYAEHMETDAGGEYGDVSAENIAPMSCEPPYFVDVVTADYLAYLTSEEE